MYAKFRIQKSYWGIKIGKDKLTTFDYRLLSNLQGKKTKTFIKTLGWKRQAKSNSQLILWNQKKYNIKTWTKHHTKLQNNIVHEYVHKISQKLLRRFIKGIIINKSCRNVLFKKFLFSLLNSD